MQATCFNPAQELCQRHADLADMLAFRHGAKALGIVLVLYDELIALRRLQIKHPSSYMLRAWIAEISGRLRQRYMNEFPDPAQDHPTMVVGTNPTVIEYSRAAFETKYHAVANILARETMNLTGPALPPPIQDGRPYMYVIDDEDRLLIWARSFTFEELVFGRNKATIEGVPVGHPMLVPERLRARAAGEIVFIGNPRVKSVIVNNKSGHFRFPPSCHAVIQECCRRVFGLPEEAIDILIAGSDAGLVRQQYSPPSIATRPAVCHASGSGAAAYHS